MSDKNPKKRKTADYSPFPIQPVGRGANQNIGDSIDANTRVSPESRTEEGILIKCVTCNYKGPQQEFMSDDKLVFRGCPECGQIDREKMAYITLEGIAPSETNIHPKNFDDFELDFSKYVGKTSPKGKPRPVQHQLRQNMV